MTQFDRTKEFEILLANYLFERKAYNFYEKILFNEGSKIYNNKQIRKIYAVHFKNSENIKKIIDETYIGLPPAIQDENILSWHEEDGMCIDIIKALYNCYLVEVMLQIHYEHMQEKADTLFFIKILKKNLSAIKNNINIIYEIFEKSCLAIKLYSHHLPVLEIYRKIPINNENTLSCKVLDKLVNAHEIYSCNLVEFIKGMGISIPEYNSKQFSLDFLLNLTMQNELTCENLFIVVEIIEKISNEYLQNILKVKNFPRALRYVVTRHLFKISKIKLKLRNLEN
jgi:hypothetical protein